MKDEYKAVGSWGTLGLEIVLSIMLGFFGGRWLDARFGTDPYLGLLGFFFGCGAAIKSILRTTKEMRAVTEREEKEQGNPAPMWDRPSDREDDREKQRDEGSPRGPDVPTTAAEDDERPS
jgi:hypothetical protein